MFHFHRYSKTIEKGQRHSIDSRLMILKRERKLFKAMTIVICAFLVCYMPWFIVQLLKYLCEPCHPHLALLIILFRFSTSLTQANSFLNPILYSWRLPKFRETFKYFWRNRNLGRFHWQFKWIFLKAFLEESVTTLWKNLFFLRYAFQCRWQQITLCHVHFVLN